MQTLSLVFIYSFGAQKVTLKTGDLPLFPDEVLNMLGEDAVFDNFHIKLNIDV